MNVTKLIDNLHTSCDDIPFWYTTRLSILDELAYDTQRLEMIREAHLKAYPKDFQQKRNSMYEELENLINDNQPESAGILLAAIITQDNPELDGEIFIDALEGDLP